MLRKKVYNLDNKLATLLVAKLVFVTALVTGSTVTLSKVERIETTVGDVKLRLNGRFMYDALVNSSLDSVNETEYDWRRARLGLRMVFANRWRFRVSTDFPDGSADIRDLRLEYRAWPVRLAVGRMQEPFGMSESASSNYLTLMERPLPSVLGPDYSTGVRANTRGKNWGITAGVFGPDIAGVELSDNDSNNDKAVDVRGTWRAIRNDSMLMHLGLSVSLREPDDNRGVRFNTPTESTLISGLTISHPRIVDSDRYNLGGLEFGLRKGPRLLQAEYFVADVERDTATNATFTGYYIQGSWALTGEKRPYKVRNGVFAGIDPNQPITKLNPKFWQIGAWEVAARYSYLDLRDADVDLGGDIDGEEGEVVSAGVNWYPVANARLMFNALRVTEESGSNTNNETIVQMRAQLFF